VFGILLVIILQYASDGLWTYVSAPFRRLTRNHGGRALPPPPPAPELPPRDRPQAGELVLDVTDIRKEFGGLVAVNDITFRVRAGELVGLIRPNRAGKRTPFCLIPGVLRATRGSVSFMGERFDTLTAR